MEAEALTHKRESEDLASIAKSSVYVCMCEKSNPLNIIRKYVCIYTFTQRCACVCVYVCLEQIRSTGLSSPTEGGGDLSSIWPTSCSGQEASVSSSLKIAPKVQCV